MRTATDKLTVGTYPNILLALLRANLNSTPQAAAVNSWIGAPCRSRLTRYTRVEPADFYSKSIRIL